LIIASSNLPIFASSLYAVMQTLQRIFSFASTGGLFFQKNERAKGAAHACKGAETPKNAPGQRPTANSDYTRCAGGGQKRRRGFLTSFSHDAVAFRGIFCYNAPESFL
jgi:hypothetical protein